MFPSKLEMQILGVLWKKGDLTAREVLGEMPDKKKRAYTSILSVLQVMHRKGLVRRQREGLTDHWRAARRKETILRPYLSDLVTKLFGGKPSAAFLHLIETHSVDEAELKEIEKIIREHRKRNA